MGCKVYVATKSVHHRELAKKLGAVWVGDTEDPFPVKVDSSIVFAPSGEVVPYALKAVNKGGVVSVASIHMTPIPSLDYEKDLFHEKSLCSVEANTKKDGDDFLKIATEVPIQCHTTLYDLDKANQALQDLKHHRLQGSAVLKVSCTK